MPRLNLYEMANPLREPRASGNEFGAAPAQALEGMGNEASVIGERIQRREENAISDRAFGEVNTQALPILADFEKNHDIALPESLDQFQAAMQKIKSDALGRVTLRPEARAALERQLDNQITQYGKSAIAARIKNGHEQNITRLNQQFETGVNQVSVAPSAMKDVIDTNIAFVESRKDSMDQLTYEAAMKKAHAGPIQAAVNAYLAQQLPDKADEILQDPKINSLIDPDALRPMRIGVAVERGKVEQEERRVQSNVTKFQSRLGRELTPDEMARVRTLPAKKDMTPADEITELELIQQKPASQDQVDKIFKTYIDDGGKNTMFGNGVHGRALAYVTENAVAYANGHLTPDQARRFESSYTEAYGEKTYPDPVTGQPRPVTLSIPGFAKEAMRRGSSIYGGGASTGAPASWGRENRPSEGMSGYNGGSPAAAASDQLSIMQSELQNPNISPADKAAVQREMDRIRGGLPAAPTGSGASLWDQASNVAGPVAGVQRWIGSGPVPMGIGGEQVSAAQQVEMQSRNLVRALQQNPRYAEGERKSIEKDIQISPEAMSNPTAYRLRLVEIGRYIQEELQFQSSILKNPNGSTVQQRQQALQSTSVLNDFYGKLGLPQQVKSIEEAKKLPPGTQFLDENWILRQVPGSR